MIRFEAVSKAFGDGTKALQSLSFTIDKGEFFVLIGPSGCGKTTTLKLINRLITPTAGRIFIDGKDSKEADIHRLRWNIGYVLQQIALFPHMSVADNIAIVPELKGWKKEQIKSRIDELLELVRLDPKVYRDRLPEDLSGGQQQRVGVARALAADPDILLMDEPFSALDPIARESLQHDIKALQQKIKKTIVFVTHDMEEAQKLGDRIAMMENGRILQIGTPLELVTNPVSQSVADFFKKPFNKEVLLDTVYTPIIKSGYIREQANRELRDLQFIIDQKGELTGSFFQGDVLSRIDVLDTTSTLAEAYQSLERHELPALPVCHDGVIVGTVSYQNLAKRVVQQ